MSDPQVMVYTVEHDGKVFDIEGPPNATPEQLQAFVAQSAGGAEPDADSTELANPFEGGAATPQEAPAEMQGGFADELPTQAQSRLEPQDEAAYQALLKTGTSPQLQKFLQERGFASDPAALSSYVQKRDAAAAKGGKVSYDVSYALPEQTEVDAAGSLGRGVLDTLTFGTAPKIGAAVAGVESVLSGGEFGKAYDNMLDQNNAAIGADEQEHPWLRISGQLLGGLAIPTGLEGIGLRAGSEVLRAGGSMSEARAAASIAVRNRSAVLGGAYGAAHGAGSADNLEDAATGALTEGGLGAAGGLAIGAAGQALAPRQAARAAAQRAAPIADGERVAAAAARQEIDVLPADVAGPTVRRLTSAAAQAPISAAPIINGAQRAVEQTQGVRDRFASMIGDVLNPEAAGERAREGARATIARTGGRANTLYRNAEAGAVGVRVQPTQASAVLGRNIRELSDTPGGAEGLARLQGLQDAFSNGSFSVEGVRRMRTALRDEFAGAGLRGTDIERRVNQVADAANQDVVSSLVSAGRPDVARQFQLADRYWRNRIRTIDETIAPIIGKDGDASGEQIVKNLQRDMRGNNRRFASFLSAVPEESRADVRASLIGRIGRATKGAQNEEGTGFSLQTFLSNWDDIGETAKAHLFGPEARAAFNDLATIASGARQTAGYANRSNTSGGIWGNIGALAGGAALSPIAAVSGLVAQYGGGRLLASPRFTRWLARPPRNMAGMPGYTQRLTRIARAEPAIANEVLQLQRRLTEAFASSPARLAAEESNGEIGAGEGRAGNQQTQDDSAQP